MKRRRLFRVRQEVELAFSDVLQSGAGKSQTVVRRSGVALGC
jgi:hypothetical protein